MIKKIRRHGSRQFPRLFLLAAAVLPLSVFALPDIERWQTSTGLTVAYVPVHDLAMLDVTLDLVAGSAFDPPGKAGLARFTAGMLDTGTKQHDEQQFADVLADSGAQLSVSASIDSVSISLRTLSASEPSQPAFNLMLEMIAAPSFPEKIFRRDQRRYIAQLKDRLTQPEAVAERALQQAMYGRHPYGQIETVASIEAISRADLQSFYQRQYTAHGAALSIVGDISRAKAEALAEQVSKALDADKTKNRNTDVVTRGLSALPEVPSTETAVQRITHTSKQAHIVLGAPLLRRDDADYFPLLVANYILGGGGFASQLMKNVREDRGLVYSVHSVMTPYYRQGPFKIELQTESNKADEALQVVKKTVADFITKGADEATLAAAKQNLVNGFALRLDSNREILGYVAMMNFYQLPKDWLTTYSDKVAAVTQEQLGDVLLRRLASAKLAVVVVGGQQAAASKTAP